MTSPVPSSIQRHLSRWLAVQSFVALSLACIAVYAATHLSFKVQEEEEYRRHLAVVDGMIASSGTPPRLNELEKLLNNYFQAHSDASVSIWDGSTLVYQSAMGFPQSRRILQTVAQFNAIGRDRLLELKLSLDIGADFVMLERLAWTLVCTVIIGTLVISFTAAALVRRALQPLKQLEIETAQVGPGHLGARVSLTSYAVELQPWIEQFNHLLGRTEAAYEQLDGFNADVAHELRTPLSVMISQLEVELARGRSIDELRDTMESQLEETRRLSTIVTDMLFVSKADRGAKARRGPAESVAQQVEAVAEYFDAAFEEAQVSVEIFGDASISMDASLLRRAIGNLVSNAIRYADKGSNIRVEILRYDEIVRLTVANSGEPIDPIVLPRIFERFYRADESRARSSTHHGLGLAIVAAIARMHDGTTFASASNRRIEIGFSIKDAVDSA